MVTGHKLYLDGFDISQFGTPHGYSVSYQLQDGGQGGIMLDGSKRIDELAVFPIVRFPCMPLSEDQLNELLSRVVPSPVHMLNFYDPAQGQRTIRVRRQISNPSYRGVGTDGKRYWVGVTLTFEGIEQ